MGEGERMLVGGGRYNGWSGGKALSITCLSGPHSKSRVKKKLGVVSLPAVWHVFNSHHKRIRTEKLRVWIVCRSSRKEKN